MPVALVVTGTLIYGLTFLFTHQRGEPVNHTICWTAVNVGIPLLFLVNRFTRPKNSGALLDEPNDSFDGGYRSRQKVKVLFILWILFTGPRLLDWALSSIREIERLKQRDTHSSAAVLWTLLSSPKKVPFEQIQLELPWLEMDRVIPEVRQLEGVVYLPTAPAGLSLTEDLRKAIRSNQLI